MRTRTAATVLAVVALLAPAAAAHADPVRSATVSAGAVTVYPALDGYIDGTTISGSLTSSAGTERVRASVVVTTGNRVAKVWMLGGTGAFSFPWDGRIAGSLVPGTYTVTVRAEGDLLATSAVKVSAKKITRVTSTRVVSFDGGIGIECFDSTGYTFPDPRWSSHQRSICPRGSFGSRYSYDSAKASGRLYVQHVLDLPLAIRHSLGPVTASVTGTFTQTGSGSNKMWVCSDSSDECSTGSVRTWSGSARQTASARIDDPNGMPDLNWWVRLDHGHQLTVVRDEFTVKLTYYALR